MTEDLYPSLHATGQSPAIRLIELELDDEPELRCNFHVTSMSDEREFVALSYTWGEPLPRSEIRLNGHSFWVRQNLYQALQAIRKRFQDSAQHTRKGADPLDRIRKMSFRKKTTPPPSKYSKLGVSYYNQEFNDSFNTPFIWVDQLSINQSDVQERNEQVQLMAQIYSSAKAVLVWLGTHPDPEAVRGTIACLEATNAAVAKRKGSKYWSRPSYAQHDVMKSISQNPYWTRLWIVQEIMLAQKALVQLGDVVFDYEELLPLFRKGPGGVEVNQTFAYTRSRDWRIEDTAMGQLLWLRTTLQDLERSNSELTVHMLLTFMEKQQCADRRDKIFGLLGLVHARNTSSTISERISADYSLTPEGVYIMVIRNAMGQVFSTAPSALDLCRKAAIALEVDTKDDAFVTASADLLLKVIGKNFAPWDPSPWVRVDREMTLEDVKDRVRKCVWSSRLDDIVESIAPGISYNIRRAKHGY